MGIGFADDFKQGSLDRRQRFEPEPRNFQPEAGQHACVVDPIPIGRDELIAPLLIQLLELCSLGLWIDQPVFWNASPLVLIELVTAIPAYALG